jgi:hypothetical protein
MNELIRFLLGLLTLIVIMCSLFAIAFVVIALIYGLVNDAFCFEPSLSLYCGVY